MSKHTRTPWSISRGKVNKKQIRVGNESRELILIVNEDETYIHDVEHLVKCVNLHNEFLGVLKKIYRRINLEQNMGQLDVQTVQELIAVIAKAEGEA